MNRRLGVSLLVLLLLFSSAASTAVSPEPADQSLDPAAALHNLPSQSAIGQRFSSSIGAKPLLQGQPSHEWSSFLANSLEEQRSRLRALEARPGAPLDITDDLANR